MEEKRPTSTTTQPSADESVGRHEHSEHEEPDEEPAVEPDAEPDASEYDMRRNLAFTAFGAIWSVPGRIFYQTLARYVPTNTLAGAVKGALIGELGMDIPVSCPLFFISTDFMRGRDKDFVVDHLRRDYLTCAASSFCLWAPATVINLRLVPLQYRVMFDSVFVVIWNCWLSFYTNRKTDRQDETKQQGFSLKSQNKL
jgi:hypothetical protein